MFARCILLLTGFALAGTLAAQEPVTPKKTAKLFNGKDLTGLTTWLRDTKNQDPRKVFTARDGILHVSGDGFGYIATAKEYRDYHLNVEYKWGKKTDGGKFVRNSGILLHATGPDGGAGNGAWMSCIECQLAQGCVGDLIVIRGKDKNDNLIRRAFTADSTLGPDQKPRWSAGADARSYYDGQQLWWDKHESGFKELLDTRGKDDLDSPFGEWTKVECLCRDRTIEIRVNGVRVNMCDNVDPAAGKILLQSEGFEIDFRRFELKPLQKPAKKDDENFVKVEFKGKLDRLRRRDRLDQQPPEVWFLNAKKFSCILDFGENKDLLDLARRNYEKTVVVSGAMEYGRAPVGQLGFANHLIVSKIKIAEK